MTSIRRQIVDNVVTTLDAVAELGTIHKWKTPNPSIGAGPYVCVAAMTETPLAYEGGFTIKGLDVDLRIAMHFDDRSAVDEGWDLLEALVLKAQEALLADVTRGLPASVFDTLPDDYSIAVDSEAGSLLVARVPVQVKYRHQHADLEAAP